METSVSNKQKPGDIVLTGMGVVSPFGLGVEVFKKAVEERESAAKEINSFEIKDWCRARLAAMVPKFSLEELIKNPKEASRASPQLRLAWAALHLALEDAGLAFDGTSQERVGIFVGTSRFLADRLEYMLERILTGKVVEILPIRIDWIHPHGTTAQLSYIYKIVGPTLTFAASCQSGIQALESAMLYLKANIVDIALVLSSDTLSPFQFHTEAAAGILSSETNPNLVPRPYDRAADGMVLAEGAAALILEREGDARARQADIQARIAELKTTVEPIPFPPLSNKHWDMTRSITRLFECLDSTELDLIHANGRGIPEFDLAESQGIQKALNKNADRIPVTSIQGSMGHAGGTSALFQIVSTVLSIASSAIPPIRNLEHAAGSCDLNYVTDKPMRTKVGQGAVLSHGWGGHHSSVLIRKV